MRGVPIRMGLPGAHHLINERLRFCGRANLDYPSLSLIRSALLAIARRLAPQWRTRSNRRFGHVAHLHRDGCAARGETLFSFNDYIECHYSASSGCSCLAFSFVATLRAYASIHRHASGSSPRVVCSSILVPSRAPSSPSLRLRGFQGIETPRPSLPFSNLMFIGILFSSLQSERLRATNALRRAREWVIPAVRSLLTALRIVWVPGRINRFDELARRLPLGHQRFNIL